MVLLSGFGEILVGLGGLFAAPFDILVLLDLLALDDLLVLLNILDIANILGLLDLDSLLGWHGCFLDVLGISLDRLGVTFVVLVFLGLHNYIHIVLFEVLARDTALWVFHLRQGCDSESSIFSSANQTSQSRQWVSYRLTREYRHLPNVC